MILEGSSRVSCHMEDDNSASSDGLDSLLVYQFNANAERVRSLHIYATNGHHEAVLQDFLLSPGGYCILKTPGRTFLASDSAVAEHINHCSRDFLARGWTSILAFSINLQISTPPCPLLSPSKNPLLRSLATLYPDLCFVEAVLANLQEAPRSPSTEMPSTPPHPSRPSATDHPPSESTSKRGFKVPRLDIPSRQSGGPGPEGDLPRLSAHTWDALLRKRNQLPEFVAAQEQWGQTVAAVLAQAGRATQFDPLPHSGSLLTLDTPSPQIELRSSSNAHPPRSRSYNDLSPAVPLAHPTQTLHDARVESVNALLASLTAQSPNATAHQGSPGMAIPSCYRAPIHPSNNAANFSLSLPHSRSSDFSLAGFHDVPAADVGSDHAAAWSTRGNSSATFAPQAVHWPTAGFASQWPAAPGTVTEHCWAGNEQRNSLGRSSSNESLHSASFSRNSPHASQPPPKPTGPASTVSPSNFAAHVTPPLPRPTSQTRLNLIELLVGAKEAQLNAPTDHFLPPSPGGFSEPATPTPHAPDLIGDAFAALEQGIARPRPVRSPNVSSASSASSLEDLRTAMSGSFVLAPFSPASLMKQEQGSEQGLGQGLDHAFDAAALKEYEAQVCALTSKGERVRQLTREEIAQFFDLPISEASKKLGVGLTMLKKRCRDLGIHRWPHRKLKSMKALIETVQQLGARHDDGPAQQIGSAIERLEAERVSIEAAPTLKLTHETRKFRQACFKAKYKMRSMGSRKSPTGGGAGAQSEGKFQ